MLVSDENPIYIKVAVYQGIDRVTFLNKREFRGSIVSITKEILSFADAMNSKYVEIVKYQPERIEIRSYPEVAIRETIVNAICHTDYTRPAQIKVEFFDDRLEVISPGNIYAGVTLDEILRGKQSIRNPRLINLLDKLDMIENYGKGLQRTLKSYEQYNFKPELEETPNFFTVSLPNIKYHLRNTTQETTQESLRIINILELIKEKPNITRKEMAKAIGISENGIKYHLEKLKESNKIHRVGSTKSGYWKINY